MEEGVRTRRREEARGERDSWGQRDVVTAQTRRTPSVPTPSRVPFISRRCQYIANDSHRTFPIHAYRGKTAPATRFHPFAHHSPSLPPLFPRLSFSPFLRRCNLRFNSVRLIISRDCRANVQYAFMRGCIRDTRVPTTVVPRTRVT